MAIKLFNNELLETGLKATWERNNLIADNIANADTPGKKRQDINFEEVMKDEVSKMNSGSTSANAPTTPGLSITDPRHISMNPISSISSNIKVNKSFDDSSMKLDGNNIDIDYEMAELAKNQLLYSSFSTLISKDFGMLRTAIREGR